MALSERLPGFEPGSTGRNVIIAILYIVLFPLWILLLPFIVGALVWRDSYGWASSLSRLPGITPDGGAKAGLLSFAYVFVILMVVAAASGGDDTAPSNGAAEINGDASDPNGESGPVAATDGGVDSTATPTPEPTETPSPEPTDSPTPEPTDTPTPAPTPAPDEASYSYSASGGDVTGDFDTAGGLVVFDLSHDGSNNFIVYAVDPDGNEELLVNHIGSYDGLVAIALPADNYVLDIDADGNWQADVRQPRYSLAEVEDLPTDGSGTHHDYFGPFEFEGRTELTFRVTNDAHAAVWLTNVNGEKVSLLVNDIGPFEETTTIRESGYGLIVIDTDGAEWEIRIGD